MVSVMDKVVCCNWCAFTLYYGPFHTACGTTAHGTAHKCTNWTRENTLTCLHFTWHHTVPQQQSAEIEHVSDRVDCCVLFAQLSAVVCVALHVSIEIIWMQTPMYALQIGICLFVSQKIVWYTDMYMQTRVVLHTAWTGLMSASSLLSTQQLLLCIYCSCILSVICQRQWKRLLYL